MARRLVLIAILVFVVLISVSVYILGQYTRYNAIDKARTEADFITADFIIEKTGSKRINAGGRDVVLYGMIKPQGEAFTIRLPQGMADITNELAGTVKTGDTIRCKMLEASLAAARHDNLLKKAGRWLNGNDHEVMAYMVCKGNDTLINKDIHSFDESRTNFSDDHDKAQRYKLLIYAAIPLLALIGFIIRKLKSTQQQ